MSTADRLGLRPAGKKPEAVCPRAARFRREERSLPGLPEPSEGPAPAAPVEIACGRVNKEATPEEDDERSKCNVGHSINPLAANGLINYLVTSTLSLTLLPKCEINSINFRERRRFSGAQSEDQQGDGRQGSTVPGKDQESAAPDVLHQKGDDGVAGDGADGDSGPEGRGQS